jgi:hypothetical protein
VACIALGTRRAQFELAVGEVIAHVEGVVLIDEASTFVADGAGTRVYFLGEGV